MFLLQAGGLSLRFNRSQVSNISRVLNISRAQKYSCSCSRPSGKVRVVVIVVVVVIVDAVAAAAAAAVPGSSRIVHTIQNKFITLM